MVTHEKRTIKLGEKKMLAKLSKNSHEINTSREAKEGENYESPKLFWEEPLFAGKTHTLQTKGQVLASSHPMLG